MKKDLFSSLSPLSPLTLEQNAILKSTENHKIVNAVPGSGKTKLLISNAKLVNSKVLILSFSKRTCLEIKKRLKRENVTAEVQTLHGFCFKQVKKYAQHLGFQSPVVTCLKKPKKRKKVSTSVSERRKLKTGKINYEDQIEFAKKLFEDQDKLDEICSSYNTIMVDEIQDLNFNHIEMLSQLAYRIGKSIFVGDPSQSIYSFQGALVSNFEPLKIYLNAKEYNLTSSFRLTKQVAALANAVQATITDVPNIQIQAIKSGSGRNPEFWKCNDSKQHDLAIEQILQTLTQTLKPEDITILARDNLSLFDLYRRLRVHTNFPIIWSGRVAQSICYNTKYLLEFLEEDFSNIDKLLKNFEIRSTKETKQAIFLLKESCLKSKKAVLLVKKLREAKKYLNFESRLTFVQDILKKYMSCNNNLLLAHTSRIKFLSIDKSYAEVCAVIETYSDEQRLKGITLQTIHSSKGLECKAVIISNLVDRKFPYRMSLDRDNNFGSIYTNEERRLFYVAITRAKQYLYLVSSTYNDFYSSERSKIHNTSLFLTPEVLKTCKQVVFGTEDSPASS